MVDVHCPGVGERLSSSYVVRGELARRGSRRLFEADDLVLGRRVTIEVCPVSEGAQLVREAKALAAVRHPGVPAVYGLGLEKTFSYVVLERVYGVSLAELMAERRTFHVAEILPPLVALADAIAAVHGAGLVPAALGADVVVLSAGERVVLLGGVRQVSASTLVERRAEDARTFGRLAFQALIGAPPADDAVDISALRPDVPATLSDLVASCLARSPDQRPPLPLLAEELRAIPLRRRPRAPATVRAGAHSTPPPCTESVP